MKTNRDLHLTSLYWSIDVPAGAEVVKVPSEYNSPLNPVSMYALRDPRPYGVNNHDAKHRWVFVPADAVSS